MSDKLILIIPNLLTSNTDRVAVEKNKVVPNTIMYPRNKYILLAQDVDVCMTIIISNS